MLNITDFTTATIMRDLIIQFAKKLSNDSKLIISIISILTVIFIPFVINHTQNTVANIYKKYAVKYNLSQYQITDDHINITTNFHIAANAIKLNILKYHKDAIVLDIFANQYPSSVWTSDADFNKAKTFINSQNHLSKLVKQKKIQTTQHRRAQHAELMQHNNYHALNFHDKEPNFQLISYKNLKLKKEMPIDFGIYTVIYFQKAKLYYVFVERGGCQVQNYTEKNRNALQTQLYYNTEAFTKEEMVEKEPLLFTIFQKNLLNH
jgi:hypothetical protein